MLLADLTWPDIAALSKDTPVIFPVAALEQHGRHMPVFTDSMLMGEIARRAEVELKDEVLFAPLQWLGNSHHHMEFPGTMSAEPRVYLDLVIDNICGYGHLSPIHGSTVERYENEFRAHVATQRQCGPHRTLVGAVDVSPVLHTDTTYHDPGVLIAYLTGLCKWILMIKQVGCTVDRSKTAEARSSACSRRPFCHSLALVRRRTLFLPGFLSHAATCRSPASAGVTIFGSALSE